MNLNIPHSLLRGIFKFNVAQEKSYRLSCGKRAKHISVTHDVMYGREILTTRTGPRLDWMVSTTSEISEGWVEASARQGPARVQAAAGRVFDM